jgi:transposase
MKKDNDPKSKELRKQGCLNRRPDKVKSELFQHSDFFDPRDIVQVKYEMLRRIFFEQAPIQQVGRQFGFSRPSVYKALANFKDKGLPGLIPDKPGPRRAHKLSESVVKFVEEQKKQEPTVTLDELVTRIKDQFGLKVHIRSIQRALKRKKKKSN